MSAPGGGGFVPDVTCDGATRPYAVVVRTFAAPGEPLPLFRRGCRPRVASLFSWAPGAPFCFFVGSQAAAEVRIS